MELQDSADVCLQGPSVTDQLAQQLRFEATALGCPRPTPARQAAQSQGQNSAEQWGLYVDMKPAGVPAGQLNKLEQRLAAASKEQQAGRGLALLLVASADCRCGPRFAAGCLSRLQVWALLDCWLSISKQMGAPARFFFVKAASRQGLVFGCCVWQSAKWPCLAAGPCGSQQVWALLDCVGLTTNAQSCCCVPNSSS